MSFSQVQTANRLGVSSNTVARWEREEMSIPPYLHLALKTIEAERDLPVLRAGIKRPKK